jgi:O-antigen/teichoic acid export membrane protein
MNESVETNEARRALAAGAAAESAGRTAARRYVRRYLLGLGAAFAAWLLGLAVIGSWFSGSALRAVLIALSFGLLVGLALMPARAEPVRARLSGRIRVAVILGGSVLFGVLAGLADDFPAVTAAGAVLVFAYWAVCAWWFSRDR